MSQKSMLAKSRRTSSRRFVPVLVLAGLAGGVTLLLWPSAPVAGDASRTAPAPAARATVRTAPAPAPAAPAATEPAAETSEQPAARAAADTSTLELPPLPYVPYPAARPDEIVQATYEFAGRHPEILKHVPCFCGCENSGHGNNHDCFVAYRDDEAGQLLWDSHAMGCGVCIDVALDAMQMYNLGATALDIQTAIDRKYSGATGRRTPTPPVTGQ